MDGISILLGKFNRAIVTTAIPVVFVLTATFLGLTDFRGVDYTFPKILGGPAIAADLEVRDAATALQSEEVLSDELPSINETPVFDNSVLGGPTGLYPDLESHVFVYEVQPGDTLSGLAKQFSVTLETIYAANPNLHARSIRPGDSVNILSVSGVLHELHGETVESVAALYGISVQTILEANPDLASGTLLIPGAKEKKTAERAKAVSNQISFMAPTNGLNWGMLHPNNAVDFANRCGELVVASADGVVSEAITGWNGGYGNVVRVDHTGGISTLYAHLQDVLVAPGDLLVQGDRLGTVGRTGNVVVTNPSGSGCHVHFEVSGGTNPFVKN